ncbi:MAG: NADH-quinone oxidoreductase subunit A [Pseudomonadota bacterium]
MTLKNYIHLNKQMYNLVENYIINYLPIVIFFCISSGLAVITIMIPTIFAAHKPDKEKTSPYECGFEPFEESRREFDVRFYLVSILFIIFDLEIIFLFPWAITLGKIGASGFWSMMIFLLLLTIGFIYEWKKGALEWE